MTSYRCDNCDDIKHEDIHECHEHPIDEYKCICLDCLVECFSDDDKIINKVI